jgi:type I restriction enzyme M protein
MPLAKLTQAELETHLWKAADILRGTVDAGDYKQYIFGLLFYKRLCDVWDEEYEALLAETGDKDEAADPDEHRFHLPPEHRWEQVRKQSTQIGQRLNNAFAAIEDANLRLRGVFGDVDFANQERFPDARMEQLLAHFEKHRLRNVDCTADMLGDAYMYLIKMFAEGSGKKGGEFYTPRQVVRLIVECLAPKPGMSIYDPTCGSAGMLLEAVQYLRERGENPRSLALYGQEKNLATWAIAQINLFLHDIDDAFIAKGDTILDPKRYNPKTKEFTAGVGAYDRVLANPPFSEKVWGFEVWSNGDPYGRDPYGCPPKGYGDLAFVQHMVASLKDDGMLGVVVPHGVLFRGGAEGRIREVMLKADIIEAVMYLDKPLKEHNLLQAIARTNRTCSVKRPDGSVIDKPHGRIVDLGAAPGGWAQVAAKAVGSDKGRGKVIGIDLLEIEPIAGVDFEVMDFLLDDAPDRLKAMLGGDADVVMSDMAANTTGHKKTDHLKIVAIAELAGEFAREVLAPGGSFIAKVLQGGTEGELLNNLKRDFAAVRHYKPAASRPDSAELYVVATGYRGTKHGARDEREDEADEDI